MKSNDYVIGMKLSIPVFLGYFSVSFGFGALAVTKGVSVLQSVVISLTNLTSAGQFAGLSVIAASASIIDMIITQLVINSRYALMSVALSQKIGDRMGILPRLFFGFHNTDEIFAIAMNYGGELTVPFLMGLGILPLVGWTLGTLLGAVAGTLLPGILKNALAASLFGMFTAIVLPQAKKSRPILVAVTASAILSCAFRWIPLLSIVTEGLSIVIIAIFSAILCAFLFPIDDEKEKKQ